MPLTVNVGLNRKASRDFQSAGVSINLAAELDMGLLADPPRLQHEIEKVYMQAEAALDKQVHAMTVTVTTPVRAELPSASQTNGSVEPPPRRGKTVLPYATSRPFFVRRFLAHPHHRSAESSAAPER